MVDQPQSPPLPTTPRPKRPKLSLPPTQTGMNKTAPGTKMAEDKGETLGQPKGRAETKVGDGEKALTKEKEQEILQRIRKRMELCVRRESGNRKGALEDRKFKAGDQWPADVSAQRNTDKRPCLTVNQLPTFINQVTNDQRQNRPAINYSPIGDKGDKEAAKMFKGMTRSIERDCAADIAYDTAFDDAVTSGFGYWRYTTEYESPDSFAQVIVIKRIRNPFTIYLDPNRLEPDGSDAKYGFQTEMVPRWEFEEEYPDAQPVPFMEGAQGEALKDWIGKDEVRVAEYFEIEFEKRTLVKLENGFEGWEDELSEANKAAIKAMPDIVLEKRESEQPRVMWYKVTGVEILEHNRWLGKWIPIVEVIGNEVDIAGDVKRYGLVRMAKDPQRMLNYWETSATELIALAPKAPWIVAEGQIEGYERYWKNANVTSRPYMEYKPVSLAGKPVPPPNRQPFAGIPAGVQQALENQRQHMMAVTGIRFDATNQERMNDESGVAVRELRRTSDLGSLHYVDNLSRSLRHGGRILVDLIPKIYDEKRRVTILHADDSEELIEINPHQDQAFKEIPGKDPSKPKVKSFNPKIGKYGIAVTIGPSFATKRIEAAESMMEFAKAMPQVGALVADLIAKNMDWEGADEMAARLAKALPPNLLTPEQKDVPPQIQALIQNLQGTIQQQTGLMQQMQKALEDKDKDRQVAREKIEADTDVKILQVMAKVEDSQREALAEQAKRFTEILTAALSAYGRAQGSEGGPSTQASA